MDGSFIGIDLLSLQRYSTSDVQYSSIVDVCHTNFLTTDQLGKRLISLVDYNFLFHVVDIVRSPLLGKAPSLWSWVFVGVVTFFGWIAALMVFSRFRRRISYWI